MASQPDDSDVIAGDGPGARYVTPGGTIALALYLFTLTLLILFQLYERWPSCELAPVTSTSDARTTGASNKNVTSTSDTSVVDTSDLKTSDSSDMTVTDTSDVSTSNTSDMSPEGSAKATSDDACLKKCRSQLFVLVLLAGALGSCFHALRSLWMFVGNRNLKRSWVLMYILLPLNGAALALIFFFIISAGSGFFSQPQGSNSCFWIIGIAALVGMFSQEAAEKLKKIATSFFTDVPPKADPLSEKLALTAINPTEGPVAGGTTVTITGTGFTSKSVVTFGSLAGTSLKFGSSSSIQVDTPAATQPGPVDVTVTDPGSGANAVRPGGYTYLAATPSVTSPAPELSLTGVDPAEGPVAGGTTVAITGTGFTSQSVVTFGSLAGTSLKLGSSSSIQVDTPAATQPGPVDVTVTDPGSSAKAVKPGGYTYT